MAPPPDLLASTPPHLAEKILHGRAALEGERRTVTVLFADAAGSTPLAERIGEERMYGLMQDSLARMLDAIHHYEGHVAQFTGDGVMALFGAPIAVEESERRAVAAALRMQRSLEDYAAELDARHGVAFHFRVGLNTGPVVVGKVSDELAMDFSAIGDTVNLAARMEQMAAPGSVYLTDNTYRAVADHFECEPLGELAVKGKAEPVAAYRALREKPLRTRLEVAAERGLAPLVGREAELAALQRHLERARQGRGQLVVVSGEAGIGKSRLLLEFQRRLADSETRWLEGHCIAYGRNIPYLPVVDLLKRAFGVEEGDDEARIIERVETGTSNWEEAARATAPYLRHLLSVDPGDPRVLGMDPRERRAGIFDSLRALLHQESTRGPLVVVVEDLHWVDEMSEAALAVLTDVVPSVPVLLLLTHRPGYATPLGERTYSARLTLDQLGADESAALARGVLRAPSLPAELDALVAEKAEGNPFYIEEVVRSLVEGGVLTRSNGSYAMTRALGEVRIPGTVQEVILARIDRLEREAKAAIQLASVIGREFTVRLLDRISDLQARLEVALTELKGLELIYEKARFPELAYMFKHALTHDVAYSTLLLERRRALHRIVAAAIEELYADRLAEHYETLAHHYWEGEDWTKALEYLDQAGRKAAAAFANQDALDYYARALSACEKLGEATLVTEASLAHRRGLVSFGIGRFPDCIADMIRMLDAARRLGDRHLEGIALAYRGFAEMWNHQPEATEGTLLEALALEGEELLDVRVLGSLFLALQYLILNRHAEAGSLLAFVEVHADRLNPFGQALWRGWVASRVELFAGRVDTALALVEAGRDATREFMAHRLMGRWSEAHALGTKGEYERARSVLEDTLATCERVGDVVVRVRCLNTMGWIYGELRDYQRAMEWNWKGLEMARAIPAPNPEVEMNALINLADNLVGLGRLDEAEEHFLQVEAVVRDPDVRWMRWRYGQRFFHSFGDYWLARGDLDRALACANECLELAERSGSRKNIAKGRRLRGQALLAKANLDDADEEILAALGVATEVGNPPQIWKTYVALGDLRTAQGRSAEARRAYGEALSVIENVASSLADEELRETFRGSDHARAIRRAAERSG